MGVGRKTLVAAATSVAVAGGGAALASAQSYPQAKAEAAAQVRLHAPPPTASISKTCSAGYVHAIILGRQKCLRRGEFCTHTRRAERDYRRYHFSCANRDRRGNYHLRRT
jgi:hypothetical protein